MGTAAYPRFAAIALLSSFLVACAGSPPPRPQDLADANDTGAAIPARDQEEKAILHQIAGLPAGVSRSFGNATVVADAAYTSAADGRTCRALRIGHRNQPLRQRLACTEGRAWFFVPDVLGLEAKPQ